MTQRWKGIFDKKVKAYSVAAVGALAVAPAAQAAVQYSGVQNLQVSEGNDVVVDLNGDGNDDFRFWVNVEPFAPGLLPGYSGGTHYFLNLDDDGYSGQGAIWGDTHDGPANLSSQYQIRSTLGGKSWVGGMYQTLAADYLATAVDSDGNFNGRSGYIGVRFNASCGTAFGWIQFQATNYPIQGTIIDWAYEDNCGPIAAGDTSGDPIPTLNQWGILALLALLSGAAANRVRRKKRRRAERR